MTLDQMLSNLLDALEEHDPVRAETMATQALDYVNAGKPLGNISKDELLFHLNRTITRAQEQKVSNKRKSDLIESIVNFKGE